MQVIRWQRQFTPMFCLGPYCGCTENMFNIPGVIIGLNYSYHYIHRFGTTLAILLLGIGLQALNLFKGNCMLIMSDHEHHWLIKEESYVNMNYYRPG